VKSAETAAGDRQKLPIAALLRRLQNSRRHKSEKINLVDERTGGHAACTDRSEKEKRGNAMLTNLFDSTTVGVLEQVVNFSQARHGVLAGNIANLDTPGYKTRDLSPEKFQENLKQAIDARHQPYSAGAMKRTGQMYDFNDVRESLTDILHHDGSDVSLEKQIAEISKNQAQHNMAIGIMSTQFRLLESAISERPF